MAAFVDVEPAEHHQDLTNVGHMDYARMVVIAIIAEAKAQRSQLALRASRGEEINSRHGQPIARIVPLEDVVTAAPGRGFGIGRGDFTVPSGFR